jgi:Carboxypeptidase regulatory-like domain/TonB-dependent Receptor Plug Domain
MMKRVGIWLIVSLVFCVSVFAQSDAGKIKGKVTDESGAPVEFATVVILQNGIIKGGANTDENGEFSIAPVFPGSYEVRASFAGNTIVATGISVAANKTVPVNLTMQTDVELENIVITETIPIDNTTTGGSLSQAEIQQTGLRNINTLAAIVPGVYQADDGDGLSMRGGRSSGTVYFVDGVKVRGNIGLPQRSISNLSVITGGTPAEYGDVMGGIVSVTTSSPSYKITGGGELLTSQFLDPYGFNLLALNLSGPLITKYVDSIDYHKPILGFFVAGEIERQKDQDPAFGGINVLREDVYSDLQANPLTTDESGNFFVQRANFLDASSVETSKYKFNNQSETYRLNTRLDFQPSDNVIVKFGGDFFRTNSDGWSINRSLLAYEGNDLNTNVNYRAWGRFQQSFDMGPNSDLKNLFYQLQVDWSRFDRESSNPLHGDNHFDYGYIGKFDYAGIREFYTYVDPFTNPETHNNAISSDGYYITAGYGLTGLSFDATDTKNPLLANYDRYIFDYVAENGVQNPFTGSRDYTLPFVNFLPFYGGLRNGDNPASVYSLYGGTGTSRTGYSKTSYGQARLTGQASGEFKGHAIKVGFEFEQRQERFYGVASRNMWNYARQLTNDHLEGLNTDPSTWELVEVNGVFQDTVHAPILFERGTQTNFDRELRFSLGLDTNGTDLINIDALRPDQMSLDMFSANELLNDGNLLVSYYGYDFLGNKTKRVAEETFFSDLQNRPMNAFAPTYVSGFIQDKFELEDIIFNVGLRIDRFDANQKVLKDLYSLYPTYTAAEAHENLGSELPANIGADWVPYMNDISSPTEFLGYRDPENNIWYDPNGNPVSSGTLRSGGKVQPYLKDDEVTINSFEDYTPQTIVMPRLSFSFPISGEAVFFAHYDVLAQRPGQTGAGSGSLLAGQLADYFFLANSATVEVQNPNLRPERTIDYEVGFKQKLNDYLALSISAFYREMRDMLQITSFVDAYPVNYTSYSNIDFGTVKGFTFAMNMIRMKNIRMTASYTMQFAAGTGSSFSSARNALSSVDGFTAIRALLPLDFDQRHRITSNIDYRFMGDDNKGPAINLFGKTVYPFANAGANLTTMLGSGTPYSVNALANAADVQGGINQSIQLDGTPNGSRLPWQVRFEAKIDKDFIIGGKQKLDAEGKAMVDSKGNNVTTRAYAVNVYLLGLNLLNSQNVLNVYKTSGLPDDDGYLSTGVGQQAVAAAIDGDAFTYLYRLKMANPNNYSLPRRLRLGIQFNF